MPDFINTDPSDENSENSEMETPILAPAEDIPEGLSDVDLTAGEPESATEDEMTAAEAVPLTADRALNIAFGAALLLTDAAIAGAKKLGEQSEFIQNNAPAVLDALEEKGKPVRETVMEKLRGAVGFSFTSDEKTDAATSTDENGLPTTAAEADVNQELPRPAADGDSTSPLSGGSAEAEISALERRVRELEQEVSKPFVMDEPVLSAPTAPFDLTDTEGETPAELGTYDFAPDAPDALANSDYAMSETPEEAALEASEMVKSDDERTPGEMEAGGETGETPAPETDAA